MGQQGQKDGARFAVGFSYAGENRALVAPLAEELARRCGRERVLFDRFHEAELARLDLDVYLPRLYRDETELIVVLLSPDYPNKRWCGLEWRWIRQLIVGPAQERIMLLRVGDPGDLSELGILSGDGYLDVTARAAAEISALILERMEQQGVEIPEMADPRVFAGEVGPTPSPLVEVMANPFGVRGCIRDPARFFDRDELLRRIFEELGKGLEDLRVFITREVWSPEQVLLQTILQRWRSLVSGASGRLGQQVVSQPVANPYVAGNPVTGQLFVGRDDILRELEELWLSRRQVDSVVLFGHRRMGKSSILKNLPDRLDPVYNRVVQFNLQKIGTVRHTGELLHALALEMRNHLPTDGPHSPAVPDLATFEANCNRAFSGWLKAVAPLMAQQRFIVAIDEYELLEAAMAEGRIDASLTTYLRSVIQSTDWFVLVLAGLHTLEEKCHDYWHPLFASIKPRKVSFLLPPATRLLLCQPSEDFPLNYTADTVEEVVRLSNGQPYLVQLIGQNLVTRYNRQVFELGQDPERSISLDDLQAVIDSPDFFQDGSPYFKGIWMQAADPPLGQQAILKALAQESKDLQQLAAETGLSEDMAKDALSTLTVHDVVLRRPVDHCYGFTVELMRRGDFQERCHSLAAFQAAWINGSA